MTPMIRQKSERQKHQSFQYWEMMDSHLYLGCQQNMVRATSQQIKTKFLLFNSREMTNKNSLQYFSAVDEYTTTTISIQKERERNQTIKETPKYCLSQKAGLT
jgi:hypothetical protein